MKKNIIIINKRINQTHNDIDNVDNDNVNNNKYYF